MAERFFQKLPLGDSLPSHRLSRQFFVALAACFATLVAVYANTNTAHAQHFARLDDSQTGIDFVSRLLPDHPKSYLYHSGMTCSGIAAGDVDGDGKPDLFLANGPGSNALYLQTEDSLQFEDVTEKVGVAIDGGEDWAAGVAMADVDNDGDLDIYVCNYDAPNQLFINEGAGDGQRVRFSEQAEIAGVNVTDASHNAAFCDYDNDGDLDFYLLTNRLEDPNGALAKLPVKFERPGVPSLIEGAERYYGIWIVDADNWGVEPLGRADYLFRNEGSDADGQVKFTDVTTTAGIAGRGDGLTCTWSDVDLDGDCDLYVCNDFSGEDRFYFNNGNGTFENRIAESVPHTTWFSMGSNAGDLDNDGDFDLLIADMSATSHYKSKVTMGIMGGMELKRANTSNPPQYMRNTLMLNERDGNFREAAFLAGLDSSDWTWSVKLNDFDADGWLDVFLTNGVPREMNHSDINITQEMLAGKHMWEFFKEGKMRKEKNLAFRNLGAKSTLKFEDVSESWGLGHNGASYGAVTADFDQDGDLDLAIMNLEENVSIYRNDGDSGNQITVKLQGTTSNRNGVGATVKLTAGDKTWIRQLMPGTGYHSYDQPILHFGLGDEQKIDQVTVHWPGGGTQTVTDVAVNEHLVIKQSDQTNTAGSETEKKKPTMFVESDALEDLWHQESQSNDFKTQPLLPHQLSSEGPCMAWGDVNGDGHLDVFVGGAAGMAGELRIATGDGQFEYTSQEAFDQDAPGEDAAAAMADFDSDGDLDLIVGRGSYEFPKDDALQDNRLYLNDGSGKFELAPEGSTPTSTTPTSVVAACDFDQDGDLDLFVGTRVLSGKYPLSDASALWINEKGTFKLAADDVAKGIDSLGMVTSAKWADVDGDGLEDLIVSREWDTLALFKNEKGTLKRFEESGDLAERTGWWNDLVIADFDGDGDVDIVAANIGLNTKYKTSTTKPMTVYYGDFDDTGKSHIVEVKQEGNVCYPERGRSCSSNAMPFIAKKFDTYHDFGKATLTDIYGIDSLNSAKKFEANTFEHGVFLNDGKGSFQFSPLPRITQISPSKAMAVADVDGDGDHDVVMGQNFFGAQSETGRYDGGVGQILSNNGDGSFSPVSPAESGFLVRAAATAVFVGDFNGDSRADIAVATNDGPLKLFVGQMNEKE